MDNENKWEYDYSSLLQLFRQWQWRQRLCKRRQQRGATPPTNMKPEAAHSRPVLLRCIRYRTPARCPRSAAAASGPVRSLRSVLALVLAAAVGFAGGYVGSMVGDHNKLVIQASDRTEQLTNALASSTSTGGDDLTTAQVAALVTPQRGAHHHRGGGSTPTGPGSASARSSRAPAAASSSAMTATSSPAPTLWTGPSNIIVTGGRHRLHRHRGRFRHRQRRGPCSRSTPPA